MSPGGCARRKLDELEAQKVKKVSVANNVTELLLGTPWVSVANTDELTCLFKVKKKRLNLNMYEHVSYKQQDRFKHVLSICLNLLRIGWSHQSDVLCPNVMTQVVLSQGLQYPVGRRSSPSVLMDFAVIFHHLRIGLDPWRDFAEGTGRSQFVDQLDESVGTQVATVAIGLYHSRTTFQLGHWSFIFWNERSSRTDRKSGFSTLMASFSRFGVQCLPHAASASVCTWITCGPSGVSVGSTTHRSCQELDGVPAFGSEMVAIISLSTCCSTEIHMAPAVCQSIKKKC